LYIAMSNYYYTEKEVYLATSSSVASNGHNLTPFLKFVDFQTASVSRT
jgi:hypothetical protein